jgi:hypothetical protein
MKNCLILGSGRSGTSLAAGVLARAGYFMGDRLNPPNVTNPKGQFEDREVNLINEALLAPLTPTRPAGMLGRLIFRSRPRDGQRWLARIPLDTPIPASTPLTERMIGLTVREPFCFKDPRFSYTLPAWRPHLRGAIFVCVFRHPALTVSSIMTQKRTVPHLKDFSMNPRRAAEVWELMYRHILDRHMPQGGEWIFLHYDQFFENIAYQRLGEALDARLDREFADPALNRALPAKTTSRRLLALYDRLCALAGYET